MGEMQRLQEAIYFGRIDDDSADGDVLAAILELFGAVERSNPRIVGPKARNAQVGTWWVEGWMYGWTL